MVGQSTLKIRGFWLNLVVFHQDHNLMAESWPRDTEASTFSSHSQGSISPPGTNTFYSLQKTSR